MQPTASAPGSHENNLKRIFQVTIIGTIVNALLTIIKISAGMYFGVQSVIADGIHSMTDLFTDTLLLLAVRFSWKPRSRARPFGNRKVETVMALIIALVLTSTATGLAWSVFQPREALNTQLMPVFIVSLLAVISKELLYRFTVGEGKRLRSPAVIANGISHRADAMTSAAILICIALGMAFGNFHIWDRIGVGIVSLLIYRSAWKVARDAIFELLDYAPSVEVMNAVEALIEKDPAVTFVHQVRVRSVASRLDISCTIEINGSLSVAEGAAIASRIEKSLMENMEGIASVMIRVMPSGTFAARIMEHGLAHIHEEELV
ncbi:cation diffusion facilitator family transporter [Desulfobotulus sp.]|jgi:cation diffusion facilitator family transporter|uniref:cation diffusion facilitator family transporter n=1 Tax=Desulfobotulus sp. TaxID=1940337 RepID=UPI002A36354C|nr:cation diffusion facilitator family transporter [Desulfobotulus sp.]MDY0164695.1 cation diffusion facilitator family transporter [Desulfobotulus sp.]